MTRFAQSAGGGLMLRCSIRGGWSVEYKAECEKVDYPVCDMWGGQISVTRGRITTDVVSFEDTKRWPVG
jgi:hypothetical protein